MRAAEAKLGEFYEVAMYMIDELIPYSLEYFMDVRGIFEKKIKKINFFRGKRYKKSRCDWRWW